MGQGRFGNIAFVKAGLYVTLFYLLIKSYYVCTRLLSGGKPEDAKEPEKVKTGRNFYMVLDGQLWVLISTIL
jgi:hypothetical protein